MIVGLIHTHKNVRTLRVLFTFMKNLLIKKKRKDLAGHAYERVKPDNFPL